MRWMAGVLTGILCWQAGGAVADDGPKVAEAFEVGPEVVVRSLAVEATRDVLWVGTSGGALEVDLAKKSVRNTFTRKDGLANEYIFAIGIDSQGYKWFGTNAGGVSRYKDGKWKTLFPMHGLADYWVYAFAENKGRMWIGTWAGASLLNLRTLAFQNYVKDLINEWVYGLAIDKKGRVWFGTEGGISMLDGKQWRHWTHKDGLGAPNTSNLPVSPNTGLGTRSRHDLTTLVQGAESYNPNYVFSVQVAQDGALWAGTWGGGVSRFDGKSWRSFTTADGLAGNIVYSMAQDARGVLWFGTNHGVSRYDGRQWKTLRRADGLLGEDVYALAIDARGDVWVGTKSGVVRIGEKR